MSNSRDAAAVPIAPPAADEQIERVIGPWGLGANAVNTAVGGGIFAMPGLVAALLGPAAIIAYLLCAVAVVLVLTCFAEIGTVVRRSGGPVAYIEEAFGPLAGFLAWIVYAVGFVAVASAAIANVLVDALAVAMPSLASGIGRTLALLVLFGCLAAINIVGVKQRLLWLAAAGTAQRDCAGNRLIASFSAGSGYETDSRSSPAGHRPSKDDSVRTPLSPA